VVRNILGGPAPYRYSDPYDAWLDVPNDALYLVDSGAETPAREASVTTWHPSNGSWYRPVPTIGDLNLVNHITCLRGSTPTAPRLVTVELSTNSTIGLNPPTGRVQIIEGSQQRTIAEGLSLPTAATVDPLTDDLFGLTLTGNIMRFSLR
jgi:hypothetical protein